MIYQWMRLLTFCCLFSVICCLPVKQNAESVRNLLLENRNLFEGDILFPDETTNLGKGVVDNRTRTLWPGGIVPYEIAPGYTLQQIGIIEGAMRKLESYVAINNVRCVQFRPRIQNEEYFILIVNGAGCSSYVGRNTGIRLNRTVTLQSSGCLYDATIMHEFLHALGFYHEQSRPDRDNYVIVNYTNIQPGMSYNFDKYDFSMTSVMNTPYDYDSVMHYSAYAFSSNGFPTLVPRQPGISIGRANNMSQYDIAALRRFYNCSSSGVTLPPITTTTTPNLYAINTTYTSQLNANSARYSRPNGGNGTYYYNALQITVSSANIYNFRSYSTSDMYAYVYINGFSPLSPFTNLLTQDDDSGGGNQFQLSLTLQPSVIYIFVVTTYWPNTNSSYTFLASGLSRVTVEPMRNATTTTTRTTTPSRVTTTTRTTTPSRVTTTTRTTTPSRTTTTIRTTTTTASCSIGACPDSVQTNGQLISLNPLNRSLTGGFIPPNNTIFNLNDAVTIRGYLRSITVGFNRTRLPSNTTSLWIYTIIPILGGYMACNQYRIPSSQISRTVEAQTFSIPNNTMPVSIGTHIGVGIVDSTASISTTVSGTALRSSVGNLTNNILDRSPLYFAPHSAQLGIKLNYTFII